MCKLWTPVYIESRISHAYPFSKNGTPSLKVFKACLVTYHPLKTALHVRDSPVSGAAAYVVARLDYQGFQG